MWLWWRLRLSLAACMCAILNIPVINKALWLCWSCLTVVQVHVCAHNISVSKWRSLLSISMCLNQHCSATFPVTSGFLIAGSVAVNTEDCTRVLACFRRVSGDWGFDNVFMPPNDKWLPPGGSLTFKWWAAENIEPQHTAVRGYAGAAQAGEPLHQVRQRH